MSRSVAALVLLAVAPLLAQDNPQLKKRGETTATPQAVDKDGLPPEEDKSVAVPVYGFNPLQAQKEIRTGNYYFKKGSYRAAAGRFEEATKWNSGEPEAWLRLGEAQEKLKDTKAARAAYTKYLSLASDSKTSDEIRKKARKDEVAQEGIRPPASPPPRARGRRLPSESDRPPAPPRRLSFPRFPHLARC